MLSILSCCSLLSGAEEIHLKKKLKKEHGGQLREFYFEDALLYEGIDDSNEFFTGQERQQITLHVLNNMRMTENKKIQGYEFVEGQAIGNEPSFFLQHDTASRPQ